jgi:ketosteroid isomerase-like protein
MTADGDRSAEAREAYGLLVAMRERVQQGELPWSALCEEFFTDDVVFIDPAWGRNAGREAVADFMDRSMVGLEDWTFPEEWTMVEGDRVVSFWWNRLPGARPDGRPYQAPGISILHYAGGGRFSYECDILNMAEVLELLRDSRWAPAGPVGTPPRRPDRDITPPR